MTAAVITASASVMVAVLVFVLSQRGQLRAERRQARLARVNSQLRDLYGPLYALVDVNERIWEALPTAGLPAREQREPGTQWEPWRDWVTHCLMPANIRMRDLILRHGDLLIETDFPQPLRDFCAHVTSYEVLLSTDAEARGHALIRHPGSAYTDYVRESFARLKAEQTRLLSGPDQP
jgi:hypothetical protein